MISYDYECCYCGKKYILSTSYICPSCNFPNHVKTARIWCKLRTVSACIAISGLPASLLYTGSHHFFGWPSLHSINDLFENLLYTGLLLGLFSWWQAYSYCQAAPYTPPDFTKKKSISKPGALVKQKSECPTEPEPTA